MSPFWLIMLMRQLNNKLYNQTQVDIWKKPPPIQCIKTPPLHAPNAKSSSRAAVKTNKWREREKSRAFRKTEPLFGVLEPLSFFVTLFLENITGSFFSLFLLYPRVLPPETMLWLAALDESVGFIVGLTAS